MITNEAELAQRRTILRGCAAEVTAKFAGKREKLGGLHFQNFEVFFAGELKITPMLRLQNFAGTDGFSGCRDSAADFTGRKTRRQFHRVREEAIAKQH